MNNLTPGQIEQMAAMLAGNQPQQATMHPQAFGQPSQMPMQPQQQASGITGCSIPVKINSPLGSVKVSVHFGADVVSPMGLQMAMQQLQAMGLQIDAWQPKPQGFGGNGGGFNRGGGFGGGNGGGRW